jgi:hypothetical protein
MYRFIGAVYLAWLCVHSPSLVRSASADDAQPAVAAELSIEERIKGEWVLYRETPRGRYMTIKDHRGDHTVVTTYDPRHNPIQSHRSDYSIDVSGTIPIFRYRNKLILDGPNAGAKDERESAYILRVDGNRFYEVHGMLPGDRGTPSMIIWERLKDNPIPKPQTEQISL